MRKMPPKNFRRKKIKNFKVQLCQLFFFGFEKFKKLLQVFLLSLYILKKELRYFKVFAFPFHTLKNNLKKFEVLAFSLYILRNFKILDVSAFHFLCFKKIQRIFISVPSAFSFSSKIKKTFIIFKNFLYSPKKKSLKKFYVFTMKQKSFKFFMFLPINRNLLKKFCVLLKQKF